MKKHLETVAKAYDRDIVTHGTKEGLSYDDLPDYITNNPDYAHWQNEREGGLEKSGLAELKDYLSPAENMNFIHLGCSLNLILKGYSTWPSTYFGVDISGETIQLLRGYTAENNIPVGALHCGSVHETPFAAGYFDIGDCVGVLEYYERDFTLNAIKEFHRILKPGAKLVLDIPNIESPSGRAMMVIEEYMGRPDKFDMLPQEFEEMIRDYFVIEDSDTLCAESRGEKHMGMMCFYYLRRKQ